MTTDEMVRALVAKHGFRLPVWLNLELVLPPIAVAGKHYWTVNSEPVAEDEIGAIHDLCAAEFARQVKNRPIGGTNRASLEKFMGFGNSSAAIKALWEALQ